MDELTRCRAKIRVESIRRFPPGTGYPKEATMAEVRFAAVYKDDPGHENKLFWAATPMIQFTMTLAAAGTAALDFFERMMATNREMYLDFTPAPIEEPAK
jgi:hypothetical protein